MNHSKDAPGSDMAELTVMLVCELFLALAFCF